MRKAAKSVLVVAPILSVLAYAVYAWAVTINGNIRIDSISGSCSSGRNTYSVEVENAGNASAYNVRVSFLIPQEVWSQNTTLPADVSWTISPGTNGGGAGHACGVGADKHTTTAYGPSNARYMICTATRVDVGDVWTISIPVSNPACGGPYFASAQVFTDINEQATTGTTPMSDNSKGISF